MSLNNIASKTIDRYLSKLSRSGVIDKKSTYKTAAIVMLSEFIECDPTVVSEEDYRKIERYYAKLISSSSKCDLPAYSELTVNPKGSMIVELRSFESGRLRVMEDGSPRVF